METLLWCRAELPEEPEQTQAGGIRPATAADEPGLAPLCGGRRAVQERLARGDHAVLADQEGCVVGVIWITMGPLRLPGYGLKVDASPQVPYLYGLRVAGSARGRGVGTALADYAGNVEGPRLGFRCLTYHISRRNPMTYQHHVACAARAQSANYACLFFSDGYRS